MGTEKKLDQDRQNRIDVALGIAIEARVVSTCHLHLHIYLKGEHEIEAAYRLGNTQFTKSELTHTFQSRRQMTDAIKEAVENNVADSCVPCERL